MKIGTPVRWTSKAGGYTSTKEGRVVYTERASKQTLLSPQEVAHARLPHMRIMFASPKWKPGGVLVEVSRQTKKGSPAMSWLYAPDPSKLEVID